MPITIKCHRCSFVLYKGDDPISPEEILKRYGYKCPRCLAPLSLDNLQISIEVTKKRKKRRKYILF